MRCLKHHGYCKWLHKCSYIEWKLILKMLQETSTDFRPQFPFPCACILPNSCSMAAYFRNIGMKQK
uniref:Uncharacterized protein n=1 Tax=Anguilla anguilla TaxID=7936 RepID=A0A0E9XEL3_ANGAN